MIYKLFEEYSNYLTVLENFSKCRYNIVCSHLESIIKGAETDPFLVGLRSKLNYEIKNNIIKEIIGSSSVVSIEYLSTLLKEKAEFVENWILSEISEGNL